MRNKSGLSSYCKECVRVADHQRRWDIYRPVQDIDGEEWRIIPETDNLYMASSIGRIKNVEKHFYSEKREKWITRKAKVMAQSKRNNGYFQVSITVNEVEKSASVHRLVCLAFNDNPEGKPFVNHIDGNKVNNRSDNLEWSTALENITHAWESGLINVLRGDVHPNIKINSVKAGEMIEYCSQGATRAELAAMFGVSTRTVKRVLNDKILWDTLGLQKKK